MPRHDLPPGSPPLAAHYRAFRVAERLLLTGHSHQAWPDVALEGQIEAFQDAAEAVDEKWARAFARADRVRRGIAARLDDRDGDYALASSTHELLVRLLSALPLRRRPRVVTTDGEYHSARRQLDRLAEEGLELVRHPAAPVETLAARLARAVDDRTALVVVSHVLFESARIVPGLGELARACERAGAALVVDAYHAVNVVPLSLPAEGLDGAFVVGGGYKYLQLGEGNAFLRLPPGTALRPAVTGWFAEFDALAAPRGPGEVSYGRGAARFAGATYDPTSHYRAARVLDFFEAEGLTPDRLRAISQRQVGRLAAGFDALDLDPALIDRDRAAPLSALGGFLALRSPRAGELCGALRRRGVFTDFRDRTLRLGPAPYLADGQLDDALAVLGEAARTLPGSDA
ncbi:MAG: aminotransferase class V-fold PLP-dependent enzyme [Acidobacteria bacterium]|nr:aminotransferase class V-fold PLP-dependent enzyme [Acidobacteriota bacterium]